jgi:L-amino acid N-acyltransferase YncA
MTEVRALKAHVALNVRELQPSIEFYRKLFAIEPCKQSDGYAKFDVLDPPLNLTLNERAFDDCGALFHLGIQVASTAAVLAYRERWRLAGMETNDEMQVICGHALQDKTWVTDPDGINWEVFVVHKDNLPMFRGEACTQENSCSQVSEKPDESKNKNTGKQASTNSPNASRELRSLTEKDWDQVRAIYQEGISTGNATFQQESPSWEEWDRAHMDKCRVVAVQDDEIVGWGALTRVSDRCVYAGVAEISVYVKASKRGQGFGVSLLEAIINESESSGIWTLQAGIFPENIASVALHKRCGFQEVGRRIRIGKLNDVWRDTLLLERRSEKVGKQADLPRNTCAN